MTILHEPSWDEARVASYSAGSVLPSELLDLHEAINRTSAENVYSLCDLPTYTTSAMDGYAISGEGPWKICGEVLAGAPSELEISEGEGLRIATGGVIPAGTDTVIEWEKVEIIENFIHATPRRGSHIRPAGAECTIGDLLLSQGVRVSPGMAGLLAAAGHDQISVVRRPRAVLFFLGDELLHSGVPFGGKVRDSIGPQLESWLKRMGVEVAQQKYIPDELDQLIEALEKAPRCDIIITTGGTADGPRDHIHPALDSLNATFIVDRVRSRPGHPTLLALLNRKFGEVEMVTPFLGLPGNPQSAIVGLMTLGQPLVSALLGERLSELPLVISQDQLSAPQNFNRLILGNLVAGRFEMGDHLGSAMLRGLAQSTGFAVAPSGVTPPGSRVRWLSLP